MRHTHNGTNILINTIKTGMFESEIVYKNG